MYRVIEEGNWNYEESYTQTDFKTYDEAKKDYERRKKLALKNVELLKDFNDIKDEDITISEEEDCIELYEYYDQQELDYIIIIRKV